MRTLEVGGQEYSRPGHSYIYHGRTRQRGCFPSKLSQQPSEQSHRLLKQKVFISAEGLQDIAFHPVQRITNFDKTSYLRGALKKSLGKVLPPRPSNPDLRKRTMYIRTLICFVLHTELSNWIFWLKIVGTTNIDSLYLTFTLL